MMMKLLIVKFRAKQIFLTQKDFSSHQHLSLIHKIHHKHSLINIIESMSSQSLKQINGLLNHLQSNISIINQAKVSMSSKQKGKGYSVLKKDKRKIVKLFQHSSWQHFMKWVNDKLIQSGQNEIPQENSAQSLSNPQKSLEVRNNEPLQDTVDFQLSQQFKLSERESQKMNLTKKNDEMVTKRGEMNEQEKEELQLLALQNGRLRRQNIILKNKLIEIRTTLPQ